LILINVINLFAQYRGAPVKRERLIKVLRSRQLQTRDIVSVINSNGVDFRLTEATRKSLIAAGARPEVIRAVSKNLRFAPDSSNTFAKNERRREVRRIKSAAPNYDELLDQAMYSYQEQRNPKSAVRYLETAVKLNPTNPVAYQMLGFVNLYGLNEISEAEKQMQKAIEKGGSAVFRVYHDDNGEFTGHCTGSLYVSPESLRFESDDNRHTFETSIVNVDHIKFDRENTREWKNRSIFKVFLKIGSEKTKFRFAPISGAEAETQMVGRFINDSKPNGNFIGLILNLPPYRPEN
jgi:tetratricopeptide (TPR) repeat protein